MTNIGIKNNLISVFNTLNIIEVKGMTNVGNLAGCMQIVKDIVDQMKEVD